jgi:CBS domain-containing protein
MARKIVPDLINGQDVAAVPSVLSARDTAVLMALRKIGAVLVVDGGKLVGICSERDIAYKVVAKGLNPDTATVKDIMTPDPITIGPDATPEQALEALRKINARHLPVVSGEQIIGVLSIRDLYAAIAAKLQADIQERDSYITGRLYSA